MFVVVRLVLVGYYVKEVLHESISKEIYPILNQIKPQGLFKYGFSWLEKSLFLIFVCSHFERKNFDFCEVMSAKLESTF